ncbi:ATP-dependent zinc metalloprotease FtsH [Oceanirhabdus sp. W0125-5]|uniref:ATP-dependent zinc metalloprotease FtsH n=1 Tax=Oceanirhabdus sp. W0125-5 TaxID=2999116 RepID=UPI0022F2EB6F|nr:ATP-dependent zinc metalloprotease FtsH [Oceanirhabdus sp. W0125-5]WBW97944.1 ATP-dependent zinc metalloprotease FtsH [Oceanirhabdus sp. W0125-5]
MKKFSGASVWIMMLVIILVGTLLFIRQDVQSKPIPSNLFVKNWEAKKVDEITVKRNESVDIIEGIIDEDGKKVNFTTVIDAHLFTLLMDNYYESGDQASKSIKISYEEPPKYSALFTLIPYIILIVLFIGIWFMIMQQSQGGGNRGVMNFGKSKARMATPDKKKVTFKDVAGADEEKEEMAEIVDFLKNDKAYKEMGARIPKGVLLVGPPGTGKTLLAKAVAGEAGVPFFTISGSDFVEMFVGVGASRVRDLFDQAKKNSPCIIFIDEIDAVGRQRGAGLGGGHDEREQTLNQLLVEMDGFADHESIIIIAATNRPDILDKALLRPGRFDRQIVVSYPDVKGREEILKVHSKNKKLGSDIDLKVIAKSTPGFTGADLENLMNEAALLAVRERKPFVVMNNMEEAARRVTTGPEKKSKVITEDEKKLTAYHEAGHAVVRHLVPDSDPVHEISIIPRGMAGGYTMYLPEKDTSYYSKKKMLGDMKSLIAGRVAEKLILGDISSGAKNDIDRMSSLARSIVMKYGMSEAIGPISFGSGQGEVFLGRDLGHEKNYSEEVAAKLDAEVIKLCKDAQVEAERMLNENIDKLHAVAKALLEKEKINRKQFIALMEGKSIDEIAFDSSGIFGEYDEQDNKDTEDSKESNSDANETASSVNDEDSDKDNNDGKVHF